MIKIDGTEKQTHFEERQMIDTAQDKKSKPHTPKRVDYEGGLLNGMRHGEGTIRVDKQVVYSGEFAFDKKEGYGTGTTQNEHYVGFWKNDFKHGIGNISYADGTSYKGHFQDDQRHGFGMFIKGSEYFTGFWHEDVRQGQFFGFSLDSGQALEILYESDQIVSVQGLNKINQSDQSNGINSNQNSQNVSSNLWNSDVQKFLSSKIKKLKKLIRMPSVDLLKKRCNPISVPQNLIQEGSYSSFYQGLLLVIWF